MRMKSNQILKKLAKEEIGGESIGIRRKKMIKSLRSLMMMKTSTKMMKNLSRFIAPKKHVPQNSSNSSMTSSKL